MSVFFTDIERVHNINIIIMWSGLDLMMLKNLPLYTSRTLFSSDLQVMFSTSYFVLCCL